jgi:hypothetical protein
MSNFRTEPPWEEGHRLVPAKYEILAEFPCVCWGWEMDIYYWILRDVDGEVFLGSSSHDAFFSRRKQLAVDMLKQDIKMLNEFIQHMQRALEMLPND